MVRAYALARMEQAELLQQRRQIVGSLMVGVPARCRWPHPGRLAASCMLAAAWQCKAAPSGPGWVAAQANRCSVHVVASSAASARCPGSRPSVHGPKPARKIQRVQEVTSWEEAVERPCLAAGSSEAGDALHRLGLNDQALAVLRVGFGAGVILKAGAIAPSERTLPRSAAAGVAATEHVISARRPPPAPPPPPRRPARPAAALCAHHWASAAAHAPVCADVLCNADSHPHATPLPD